MKRFCKKERARKAADPDEIRAEYGKNDPLLAMAIHRLTRKPKKRRLVHITSRLLEYGQKFSYRKTNLWRVMEKLENAAGASRRIDKVLAHDNPNDRYRCGI
jgi:hypothetical protein